MSRDFCRPGGRSGGRSNGASRPRPTTPPFPSLPPPHSTNIITPPPPTCPAISWLTGTRSTPCRSCRGSRPPPVPPHRSSRRAASTRPPPFTPSPPCSALPTSTNATGWSTLPLIPSRLLREKRSVPGAPRRPCRPLLLYLFRRPWSPRSTIGPPSGSNRSALVPVCSPPSHPPPLVPAQPPALPLLLLLPLPLVLETGHTSTDPRPDRIPPAHMRRALHRPLLVGLCLHSRPLGRHAQNTLLSNRRLVRL